MNYNVCGVPISAASAREAAEQIVRAAKEDRGLQVHLCNTYTLSLVEEDALLRTALMNAHLNLPDGAPVAWLGRNRGARGPIRGPSLFWKVAEFGVDAGLRHYLYGGHPGVASLVKAALESRVPGTCVVGVETPPYRSLAKQELFELAGRIRSSSANVVWIGLGTPRQDYLVPELAELVEVPVVPVGAAFDFMAGQVAEAPRWMQGRGLEWTFRLAHEPRRLWKRYFLGGPKFLLLAIKKRAL